MLIMLNIIRSEKPKQKQQYRKKGQHSITVAKTTNAKNAKYAKYTKNVKCYKYEAILLNFLK